MAAAAASSFLAASRLRAAAASSFLAASRLRAAAAWSRLGVRGVAGPPRTGPSPCSGRGDLEDDLDSDWEPERELQELERYLKQQKKEIRFRKILRYMEASGALQRILSRDAMDQIRHLHKEFSEDWSVPKLAEGFGVSTDVIRRILKSKFVPTLEQKIKQDQKIISKARIIRHPQTKPALQEQPPLPSSTGHLVSGALSTSRQEALPLVHHKHQDCSSAVQKKEKNPQAWKTARSQEVRDKAAQKLRRERHISLDAALGDHRENRSIRPSPRKQKQAAESHPDGWISKEEEEGVKEIETDGKEFSSKVFQKGREFFDSNGNFLYRI
ncbi:neugrin [Sarcophilus harrisii]|uniref:neugrin n=1 Tax=Sarcophilus harrisii TaxID=9305 RepID=UPI001301F6F6|nr:neugrin [Sarcophilus harrisii]